MVRRRAAGTWRCVAALLAAFACVPTAGSPRAVPYTFEIEGKELRADGKRIDNSDAVLAGMLPPPNSIPVTLTIRVDSADDPTVRRILRVAQRASVGSIVLETASGRVSFQLSGGTSPNPHVLFARTGHRAFEVGAVHKPSGKWAELGQTRAGDAASEMDLAKLLERLCGEQTCKVYLAIGADEPLSWALQGWQRIGGTGKYDLSVSVNMTDAAADPSKAESTAGRLPPELIQGVVRASFHKFRICYERGLAKDPTLGGRVGVRFVIGRAGKVTDVTERGSDLRDSAVRQCVLDSFKTLEFPPPAGGIVTVVYPIMLDPG